uniref:Uncharacterized protein n=1 Tax=viral metagenome TaxID=1070528 RepID=A0A6M3J8Q0_9ZZZZ
MENQIDIMQETLEDGTLDVLKELIEENVKPLIEYRLKMERQIANKEISEMYQMEQEV